MKPSRQFCYVLLCLHFVFHIFLVVAFVGVYKLATSTEPSVPLRPTVMRLPPRWLSSAYFSLIDAIQVRSPSLIVIQCWLPCLHIRMCVCVCVLAMRLQTLKDSLLVPELKLLDMTFSFWQHQVNALRKLEGRWIRKRTLSQCANRC